jgi:acetoin utilization deacetylase AcuC-like enzyme
VEFYHGHLMPYPEVPRRVEIIRATLEGLEGVSFHTPSEPLPREALTRVHDSAMLDYLQSASEGATEAARNVGAMYPDLGDDPYLYASLSPIRPHMARLKDSAVGGGGYYFTDKEAPIGRGTWAAALASATLAYSAAESLLKGETRLAYALCRPPGHHAGRDFMGGYCYINNAAVAAKHLTALGKVALVDIDYHHGNGSQDIFWDDPDVLFASIHGDPSFEYPYYAGYADETGGANAPHSTLNYPLLADSTLADYEAAFAEMMARVRAFAPAALVVSLGYDAFEDDPISSFKVSRPAYTRIGAAFKALDVPTLLVLEGGYFPEALGELGGHLLAGLR